MPLNPKPLNPKPGCEMPLARSVWQHMARHAQKVSVAKVFKAFYRALGFNKHPFVQKSGRFGLCTVLLSEGHMLNFKGVLKYK